MLQVSPFSQPPPQLGLGLPNLSVPPPHHFQNRFHNERSGHRGHFFQPFRPYPRPGPGGAAADAEFDGKRLRKSVMRKTVDYNSSVIKMLESRVWQRDFRDKRALQPDVLYYPDLQPPHSYVDNPINSVTTRFVKTATNKMRCPIFCMAWTPEGRRLVTGASSGEFTLWNGLTFNFETILQAHDSPVRTMVWSHNDVWMVTGDHAGYVKYWQSNMNNVKMFQAHKEALRGLSFSSTDHKFVTCSDDGTLRIWDFMRCHEERILRGHGADVKCVHWHPQKALIVSGSKDNQQPVKLWDPKTGQSLATLHAHKSTVMDIKWNRNGNWLVTASRDHLLKLFDVRNLSQEVQTFRGHKKEASSVSWHPCHEGLFASGGSDGAILFWHVGADKEVGGIEQAHDSIVWTLAWHPMGHILCSGSNDHSSKFWTRNRPGDSMTDKYNLNTTPAGLPGIDELDQDEPAIIPGMGPEDKVEVEVGLEAATIPGLDIGDPQDDKQKASQKKVPYSKPIPRNFQAQWNETGHSSVDDGRDDEEGTGSRKDPLTEAITQLMETNPPPGVVPVSELQPQAIIIYGKLLQVEGNPLLQKAIAGGAEALSKLIHSGQLEELHDVLPQEELHADRFPVEDDDDLSQTDLPPHLSEQHLGPGGADMDMRTIVDTRYPPNIPDQDMRFVPGDVDFRQQLGPPVPVEDQDLRRLHVRMDEDMRGHNPGRLGFDDRGMHHYADEDLRAGPPRELGSDVDLRRNPLQLPMQLGPPHLQRVDSPLGPSGMKDSPSGHDIDGRDPMGGPRKVLLTTPQFRSGPPGGIGDQLPWRRSPHEQWSGDNNADYDQPGVRLGTEGPGRGRGGSYSGREFGRGGRGPSMMGVRPPFGPDATGAYGRGRGAGPQQAFNPGMSFSAARFSPGDMSDDIAGHYQEENMQGDDREGGRVYGDSLGPGHPRDVENQDVDYGHAEDMGVGSRLGNRQPTASGFGPSRPPMGDGMRGGFGRSGRSMMGGSVRGRSGFFLPSKHGAMEGDGSDEIGSDSRYGLGRQMELNSEGRFGHRGRMPAGGMRGRGTFHQPGRPRRGEAGDIDSLANNSFPSARPAPDNADKVARFGLSGRMPQGGSLRGHVGYHPRLKHGRAEDKASFQERGGEDLDEDMEEDALLLAQRIDKDLRDEDARSEQFEESMDGKYGHERKRGGVGGYLPQRRPAAPPGGNYERGRYGTEERHGDRGYGHGDEARDREVVDEDVEEGELDGDGQGTDESWSAPSMRHVAKDDWGPSRGSGRGPSRPFRRPRGAPRGRFRGGRPRRASKPNKF